MSEKKEKKKSKGQNDLVYGGIDEREDTVNEVADRVTKIMDGDEDEKEK